MNKDKFNLKIGSLLKEGREKKKMTLSDVSKKSGRAISTISDNERGINDIPFSVVVEYCNIYGLDINELVKKANE